MHEARATTQLPKVATCTTISITFGPDNKGSYDKVMTLFANDFRAVALCTFKGEADVVDLHIARAPYFFGDCPYASGCKAPMSVAIPANLTERELHDWMVALLFKEAKVIENFGGNLAQKLADVALGQVVEA